MPTDTPTPLPTATPTPNPLLDEVARLRAENACARDALVLYRFIDGLLSAAEQGMSAMEWIESIEEENLSPDDYAAMGRWMKWLSEDGVSGGYAAPLAYCFDPIVVEEEEVF